MVTIRTTTTRVGVTHVLFHRERYEELPMQRYDPAAGVRSDTRRMR